MPAVASSVSKALPLSIHNDYALDRLNTFGLKARAQYYVKVTHPSQVHELAGKRVIDERHRLILGGGSNLIFTKDFHGLVVHMAIDYISIATIDPDYYYVEAGAGVVWHDFVLYAVQRGWGGIENLALIPGYVGGAPVQNIGAYGAEVKDAIERVTVFDFATLELLNLSAEECQFGYRDSIFKRPENRGRYAITAVTFKLTRSKTPVLNLSYPAIKDELFARKIYEPTLHDITEAVIAIRSRKLPDPYLLGNCGSFFKNPVVSAEKFAEISSAYADVPSFPHPSGDIKVPAGWLIEQCGWKGKRQGNVGCYEKQALVLVNLGGATGAEVVRLANDIEDSVLERFGIDLEREVNCI